MKRLAFVLAFAACGGSTPGDIDAPAGTPDVAIDTPAGAAFAVMSPELAANATFMPLNTCDDAANQSPQLVWSGDNKGALGYAVSLVDTFNSLTHWVIYDIPGSATGLPAAVMKAYAPNNVSGAHQTDSFSVGQRGYRGPCPPPIDPVHIYTFTVYALDVATLPGATMTTTRADALLIITPHTVAMATLSGGYDR